MGLSFWGWGVHALLGEEQNSNEDDSYFFINNGYAKELGYIIREWTNSPLSEDYDGRTGFARFFSDETF